MNHPTHQLIQDTLRSGVRPFEAWAQIVQAMHKQAAERYLNGNQLDDVFHGAPTPKKDHGKLIERNSADQFKTNLKNWRERLTREERQRIFTPRKWRKRPTAEDPKGILNEVKEEEVKS